MLITECICNPSFFIRASCQSTSKMKTCMVLHILLFGLVNFPKTTATGKVSPGLETPKNVVVIGGGLAGMAAARKLSNSPDKFSVKVLEARKERYGGRVYTKREYGVRGNGEIRNCCIQ